jgi:hypothetical protein
VGMLVSSDKPIAVNCGSFAGSNADTTNLDLGFDQIVSAERTGKEYIFIKGNGFDITERPFVIAHENGTEIFINGNATPITTLIAGEYFSLNGTNFSANNNLYLKASKNVFAYQAIGSVDGDGDPNKANQNLHFMPPLSCQTPKIINNIPFINQVGNDNGFNGTVCLVTKIDATLEFLINGNNYTLATLPTNITISGPLSVDGNTDYETYTFAGLSGNISVISSKQVYLSYYGSSGFATYGGFYSGFTFKPEIVEQPIDPSLSNCIPNVKTFSSCDGHYKYNYYVLWIHTDENMRVLNAILKSLNNIANRLFVQHFNATEKNQLHFTFRCGFDSWTKENHKGYFGEYENIPYFELRIGMNRMEKFPESFYLFTHQLSTEFAKEVNEISWTSL